MKRKKSIREKINSVWHGIKYRCYDKNSPGYKDYGGRGIMMCDEWLDSFDKFYKWAISNGYKLGLTIDRYPNNDGNYEPTNCRWATRKQQQNNKRYRLSKHLNERVHLISLAKNTGIKYQTLVSRIQRGMGLDQALSYIDNRKNDARLSKPILQFDLKGNFIAEYPSIKEVTRITDFKKPNIIHHLKGRQNRCHAYGFVWKYKK